MLRSNNKLSARIAGSAVRSPSDHRIVVDPDDPDRDERRYVRGVVWPLTEERVGQRLVRLDRRHADVEHQQGDRDGDDAVGEGFEPVPARDARL
jgi:hypothetical protein